MIVVKEHPKKSDDDVPKTQKNDREKIPYSIFLRYINDSFNQRLRDISSAERLKILENMNNLIKENKKSAFLSEFNQMFLYILNWNCSMKQKIFILCLYLLFLFFLLLILWFFICYFPLSF